MPGGVNRVILATDGDFNVGITSQQRPAAAHRARARVRRVPVRLRRRQRQSQGRDDGDAGGQGNGHYAYLDSLQEARRVLVREADATLETVAKDVKFQVEFNPAVVSRLEADRLREPRAGRARLQQRPQGRRRDGRRSLGDGALRSDPGWRGPQRDDVRDRPAEVDPLRYQTHRAACAARPSRARAAQSFAGEWLTVKARYKQPEGERSDLITLPVRPRQRRAQHLPLASAVAEFGLLLRDSAVERRALDGARTPRRSTDGAGGASQPTSTGFKELVATARALARTRR